MPHAADLYRARADQLLRLAARTTNLRERSQLIGEAAHYHELALDAEVVPPRGPGPTPADRSGDAQA